MGADECTRQNHHLPPSGEGSSSFRSKNGAPRTITAYCRHSLRPSGHILVSESYTLDPSSNLTAKTVDSLTTSYTFDSANLVLTESNTGYSSTYTYDANGNRLSQDLNGTTYSYTYDSGDKLNTVKNGSTTVKSYSYDAAGRTTAVATSAGTTSLSYDYENRVTGITYPSLATNSFTYNGLDTRVGKVDSTGTYTFKRDGADVTDPVLSDGTIAYTPSISERKSGSSTFDHANYLGTYTRQTNSSQTTTATRVYDAFGNLESTTGTPQSPFGFVGQQGYQEDSDSGLKLLGHRYYDPSTGRFLSRDPAKRGRDWYVYVGNGPAARIDPTGLVIEWWAGIGILLMGGPVDAGVSIQIGINYLNWWESGITVTVTGGYGFGAGVGKGPYVGGGEPIGGGYSSGHSTTVLGPPFGADTGTDKGGTYCSPSGPSDGAGVYKNTNWSFKATFKMIADFFSRVQGEDPPDE